MSPWFFKLLIVALSSGRFELPKFEPLLVVLEMPIPEVSAFLSFVVFLQGSPDLATP